MDFEVPTDYATRKDFATRTGYVIRTGFVDPMGCVDRKRTWQLETCGPDEPGSFACTFGRL